MTKLKTKPAIFAYLSSTIFLSLNSCGIDKLFGTKEKEPEEPIVAEMYMAGGMASDSQDRKINFSQIVACDKDPESGMLQVRFTNSVNELLFEIRDFQDSSKRYFCQQAENNNEALSHVGDLYNNCMIEIGVEDKGRNTKDQYSMHRSSTMIKRFSHFDSCFIDVEEAESKLVGSFYCENMAQTIYLAKPRNPVSLDDINAEETADFQGSFSCPIKKKTVKSQSAVSPPPPPLVAFMEVISQEEEDSTKVEFLRSEKCELDVASGMLKVSFTSVLNKLEFEIRDFKEEASEYQCLQAESNQSGETGDFYENCMVEARVRAANLSKVNGYGMHRVSEDIKDFAYQDECRLKIAEVETQLIKGNIECTGMAKTILNDLPRNPVSEDGVVPDVTANLLADFKCYLQRTSTE